MVQEEGIGVELWDLEGRVPSHGGVRSRRVAEVASVVGLAIDRGKIQGRGVPARIRQAAETKAAGQGVRHTNAIPTPAAARRARARPLATGAAS